MKVFNKIDWQLGMDINAETLIHADQYNFSRHQIHQKLATLTSYGLLPQTKYEIISRLKGNILEVESLQCEAISKSGKLFRINESFDIPLSESEQGIYYLVAQIDGYLQEMVDTIPCMKVNYSFHLKRWIDLSNGNIIPLLKLKKDGQGWSSFDYIPPVIALSSHRALIQHFSDIKKLFIQISDRIATWPDYGFLSYLLSIYLLDIESYSTNETPAEYVLLLKKILRTLSSYCPLEGWNPEHFMAEKYDHSEIKQTMEEAEQLFQLFDNIISAQPEPEPEPEPEEDAFIL